MVSSLATDEPAGRPCGTKTLGIDSRFTRIRGDRKPVELHLRRVRQRSPDVRVLRTRAGPAVPLRQPPVPQPQGSAVPPCALSPPPEPHVLGISTRVRAGPGGGVDGEGCLSRGSEAERLASRHVVVRQAFLVNGFFHLHSVYVVVAGVGILLALQMRGPAALGRGRVNATVAIFLRLFLEPSTKGTKKTGRHGAC